MQASLHATCSRFPMAMRQTHPSMQPTRHRSTVNPLPDQCPTIKPDDDLAANSNRRVPPTDVRHFSHSQSRRPPIPSIPSDQLSSSSSLTSPTNALEHDAHKYRLICS
eukprot:GFKZ01009759.1.p1 GENE.GFKZ01009759.1~~GFKZ01009759.1.p1  ORF type:complete len:108 (-),score=3.59 GFKZ01009759.1:47-370(-)